MGKILMFADDFTGSGDAGVQLTKNGIEAHIIFDTQKIDPEKSYVVDTESRNIPAEDAYQIVKEILQNMEPYPYEYYYKKMDSTLRGNLKAEITAAEEVLKPDLIVFNPANPDSNRTVVDGTLLMNGVRIMETEIMRDPLCLVTEDNLEKLMQKEMNEPVRHLSLTEIRDGKMDVGDAKIVTFDVLENADMDAVVNYILSLNKKILWVGSAGMANSLVKAMRKQYPVLSLIGSISQTSRTQVQVAQEAGATVVEMNIAALLQGGDINKVAAEAASLLQDGQDVIVVTAKEHEDYLEAIEVGKQKGMDRIEVAKYTQSCIGKLSTMILKQAKVCGCFLTGGDTAISVNNYNHAHGAKLVDEVLPIIALIELDGGDYPGLPCIVKGGSIGDHEALARSIAYLKEHA
jgi:D-threonate/D-erythronate kinase